MPQLRQHSILSPPGIASRTCPAPQCQLPRAGSSPKITFTGCHEHPRRLLQPGREIAETFVVFPGGPGEDERAARA